MNLMRTFLLAACVCQGQTPLACNLNALTKVERVRYEQLSRGWRSAVLELRELADGYAFRIDPSKSSIIELAEWIGYEHKCCPFFRFRLEVDEMERVWLSISGREGVKQFMKSEFRLLR